MPPADVYAPERWAGDALLARGPDAYRLIDQGWTDAAQPPGDDLRSGTLANAYSSAGLRIDHRRSASYYEASYCCRRRRGSRARKASDHAPPDEFADAAKGSLRRRPRTIPRRTIGFLEQERVPQGRQTWRTRTLKRAEAKSMARDGGLYSR